MCNVRASGFVVYAYDFYFEIGGWLRELWVRIRNSGWVPDRVDA